MFDNSFGSTNGFPANYKDLHFQIWRVFKKQHLMTTKLSVKIIYSVNFKFFLKSNKIEIFYFETVF